MIDNNFLIFSSLLFLAGLTSGWFVFKANLQQKKEKTILRTQKILSDAKEQSRVFLENSTQRKERHEKSIEEMQKRFETFSTRIEQTIKFLEEKCEQRVLQETELQKLSQLEIDQLKEVENSIHKLNSQKVEKLASRASASIDSLKKELSKNLDLELQLIRESKLKKLEENFKETSPAIAKNYLTEVIQRFSASTSVEKKNLTIPVSRDETVLRILGNNLEIINFIEEATGCDILFEPEKKGITVSHFQLVQKHIARETILKLIKDRVVDLERAKKRLLEATKETRSLLVEIGNKVVDKLELAYRKFPDDFKEILGRLKYRTSYGQNILRHCFEVGYFTLMMGNELGLNQEVCKIGGFFHDLGKAIDQEDGRPHDILTKEIMERFNIFSFEEIHAAWTHHDAIPIETAEALLVKAADAISAGRPGARQETIEKYLQRISAIEKIANSYEGVNKTYAISGGRELRVIVDHKQLNDSILPELANTIAREIESSVAYPGQIKVNVIRRVQYFKSAKEKNRAAKS